MFDKYDNDLDGQIPLNELSQMLSDGNNELRYDIPYEVLQEIAERADLNKDKVITYDEFIAMVIFRIG